RPVDSLLEPREQPERSSEDVDPETDRLLHDDDRGLAVEHGQLADGGGAARERRTRERSLLEEAAPAAEEHVRDGEALAVLAPDHDVLAGSLDHPVLEAQEDPEQHVDG